MNLHIRSHDNLGHSLAYPLFLRGWAELLEKGWALGGVHWSNDTQVIYAQDLDDVEQPVTGFVTFSVQRVAQTCWNLFWYTREDYRGKGVITQLNAELDDRMRRAGIRYMMSNVHQENIPSQAAVTSLGYEIEFIRFRKVLKGT